jgi:hypothetical protein
VRTNIKEDDDWQTVLRFLPPDLDSLAMATGALTRRRAVASGADLLRLALVYGDSEMSLRETSAWASEIGLAELSDVAVLNRLRGCVEFLRVLVSGLLEPAKLPEGKFVLRLIDSTTVSRQHSAGTDFRVHTAYDVAQGRISGVLLTRSNVGERLDFTQCRAGEVLVADRGYPGRVPLSNVRAAGAHVIVRCHSSNLPFTNENLDPIMPIPEARKLSIGQVADIPVQTKATKDAPASKGRLIILKKAPEALIKERARLTKRAIKRGTEIGPGALEAAQYVMLFTSLPLELADAASVLDAYRLRWQIEMLFKRAKGIVSLGETAARDPNLCECMILAKLLTMLLMQEFESAFFPWGYPLKPRQSLADTQRPLQTTQPGDPGNVEAPSGPTRRSKTRVFAAAN